MDLKNKREISKLEVSGTQIPANNFWNYIESIFRSNFNDSIEELIKINPPYDIERLNKIFEFKKPTNKNVEARLLSAIVPDKDGNLPGYTKLFLDKKILSKCLLNEESNDIKYYKNNDTVGREFRLLFKELEEIRIKNNNRKMIIKNHLLEYLPIQEYYNSLEEIYKSIDLQYQRMNTKIKKRNKKKLFSLGNSDLRPEELLIKELIDKKDFLIEQLQPIVNHLEVKHKDNISKINFI